MAFPTKILLATDGSEDAALATKAAIDLSNQSGAELHVVHVGRSSLRLSPTEYYAAAREKIGELAKAVEEAGGDVTETHLRIDDSQTAGNEAEHITGLAEELGADLIVIGSRGLSGMKRLVMGSVSESVVRHAHCPVLVMRH
jgi:nucleotide-binding universal stress UspA family protein